MAYLPNYWAPSLPCHRGPVAGYWQYRSPRRASFPVHKHWTTCPDRDHDLSEPDDGQKEPAPNRRDNRTWIAVQSASWVIVGMAVGTAIGIPMGNVAIGIALGVGIASIFAAVHFSLSYKE